MNRHMTPPPSFECSYYSMQTHKEQSRSKKVLASGKLRVDNRFIVWYISISKW